MRKETISRKRVKDRIHEWVKTHPDGQFYAQWAEFEFKPFKGGVEVKIPEDFSMQELDKWIDEFDGDWVLQFSDPVHIDDEIESHVLDKKKSLPKKGKIKERKLWVLEYKWQSKHDFNTRAKSWSTRNEEYSEDWIISGWGDTFKKPKHAEDSIKHQLRNKFWINMIEGRFWRVRNKETGEIVEFTNIENYYK